MVFDEDRQYYKVKEMNFDRPQYVSWQSMYNRLLNDYTHLAFSYHQQSQHNFTLYQQLQTLLQQKITLLQTISAPPILPPQNILQSSHNRQEQPSQIIEQRQIRKKPKNRNRQQRIRRKPKIYRCTYSDCNLSYRSAVSMNLHIKRKHNGGSKKERQAFAKMIIDAEQQGNAPPQSNINLPPNFLNEFKQNYSYIKKYNM